MNINQIPDSGHIDHAGVFASLTVNEEDGSVNLIAYLTDLDSDPVYERVEYPFPDGDSPLPPGFKREAVHLVDPRTGSGLGIALDPFAGHPVGWFAIEPGPKPEEH